MDISLEATPTLSGGEAQRLKLSTELGKSQENVLFIFDEPTIGLHPLDVRVLLDVLQGLLDRKATIIVIEHDLDLLANADYIIDMGPSGGVNGGEIVAEGTLDDILKNKRSRTARWIQKISILDIKILIQYIKFIFLKKRPYGLTILIYLIYKIHTSKRENMDN